MRIRLAFVEDDGAQYLVSAFDEYTEDSWNGVPDFYKEDLAKQGDAVIRELDITIPNSIVEALFATPEWHVPTHQCRPRDDDV